MARIHRTRALLALPFLLVTVGVLIRSAPALASHNQEALFQAESEIRQDPGGTLDLLRGLGVTRVRLAVGWATIAPSPNSTHKPNFDATNPDDYPAGNWAIFDTIVRAAAERGVGLDFAVSGAAPLWATAPGAPGGPRGVWKPSAREFGLFVRALGTRYSGSFTPAGQSTPLPAVRFWSIWNEANYGQDLAPQAIHGSTIEVAPALYRGLLDAAWSALGATGHGHDTVIIAELAPRGLVGGDVPGNFGGMVPLRFIRALYCLDSSFHQLRGSAASARSCPSSSSGSRHFAGDHPALFHAAGFAQHLYPQHSSPVTPTWPYSGPDQFADLPQLGTLFSTLDRVQRAYGSHTRFNVYSTEYGYRTCPPECGTQPSPSTAALWLNWGEYLTWRSSRVATYMQYLLSDPRKGTGFPSGLEFANGRHKATYDAFRLPLFLPTTSTRKGHSLEVWGCVRPAHAAAMDTGASQAAQIQFQRGSHGSFSTLKTVAVSGRGYFDVRITFPASGTVRLAWNDPFTGGMVYSRSQTIKIS